MLRRPEPSDLTAALIPRAGEVPTLPSMPSRILIARDRSGPLGRYGTRVPFIAAKPYERHDPKREEQDAREQQAIADAVEGVIP